MLSFDDEYTSLDVSEAMHATERARLGEIARVRCICRDFKDRRWPHGRGINIFFRSWRPERKPRGTVVIVPGFNAHSAYYAWVAEQFVADGIAVYALDLRGRGKSDGERFYVEKFEDYVSDVAAFVWT